VNDFRELLERQDGMVARRQLTFHGIHWDDVRNQVKAGRCAVRTPRVISAFTGDLTLDQRRWLAVLHAGPRALLGGLTAAEHLGMKRWERERITVLVDDELAFEPVDGVDFFRSRRSFELLEAHHSGIPCCQVEPAVLMWAGYDATERAAHAVLASAVQQRLTTAARLQEWINKLRPLRRAPAFRATLHDIDGGSHSSIERDLLRLCRRHGLERPIRQVPRRDSAGARRWTDCEWTLADGRVLILEVDGSFHMEVEHWSADKRRGRRLTGPGRVIIGCTAYEVRHEPDELASDLRFLGVPSASRVPEHAP
jgi:hypothetical protein